MKFTTLATSTLAAGLVAADDIQSKGFKLVLSSADSTINGQTISACHSGAAIEGLCLSGKGAGEYSTFYHNTTTGQTSPVKGYTTYGKLVWNMPYGSNKFESEAMNFFYQPDTNIAHPLFEPSYTGTFVAFGESNNEMALFSYVDDTVQPPKAGEFKAIKQWYACTTYYTGYTYHTLDWVVGKAKPQNPSCVPVEVKRVFV